MSRPKAGSAPSGAATSGRIPAGAHLEADKLARQIVDALSDQQAEDILLLDIRDVASFADFFVIATGGVKRQLEAMTDAVEKVIGKGNSSRLGREGDAETGWVLLDYGDVIVHLFAPHEREYYDIEGLWHTATPVVRIQ